MDEILRGSVKRENRVLLLQFHHDIRDVALVSDFTSDVWMPSGNCT